MIQQSDIEKIVRFSKGLSDAEETRYVYSLFAEKEDSNELKYYIKEEWKMYFENNEGVNYNLSHLLDSIHHRIHVIENRKKQSITRKIYRWYSVAAAVLLIPLLIAGGIWFTQGAMRNAAKNSFSLIYSEPMSQGTRCRQLALYVVFNSPINMLCDSPTEYMREPESLQFIASIPTVWDETVSLGGKVGEHVTLARRNGSDWYIGGITGWESRDMTVDLSFLPEGHYEMTLFRDGANAHRKGADYRMETRNVVSGEIIRVHLAPGGGFAVKLRKI
jgi:hypothetical protein